MRGKCPYYEECPFRRVAEEEPALSFFVEERCKDPYAAYSMCPVWSFVAGKREEQETRARFIPSSYECWTSIGVNDELKIDVCIEPREFIRVREPSVFLRLIDYFEHTFPRVCKLLHLILEYDVSHLVSTHGSMTRRVHRIRKALRIVWEEGAGSLCGMLVPLSQLLPLEYEKTQRIIEVLMAYKDEPHRIRDKVHQLLYPIIRSVIEDIMNIEIVYVFGRKHGGYPLLTAHFTYNIFTGEYRSSYEWMPSPTKTRSLNRKEALTIIWKKQLREQKHWLEQYRRETDEYNAPPLKHFLNLPQ